MKTRWIVAIAAVALIVVGIRSRNPAMQNGSQIAAPNSSIAPPFSSNPKPASESAAPEAATVENQTVATGTPPPASVPPANPPPIPVEVRDELDNVQFAVRDFRTALGENPIGNNSEITRALLGDNLKQVKIPIPAGSSVNGEGELCDHWGTPYFFHQLSAKAMEVRSAGPDRTLWSDDDVVAK